MMHTFSFMRIWAVVRRYLYLLPRDIARYFDMFYWPLMDLCLWGFTGAWMQQSQGIAEMGLIFVMAPIYWQIISRLTLEIPRNVLEEIWAGSMLNLFASPLSLAEWVTGLIIVSVIGQVMTMLFLSIVAWFFYSCNIFALGLQTIPLVLTLSLFGIALGLTCAGLIVYKGSRIGTIAWAIPWLFAPISGIFYPIHILPASLQLVGCSFPPAYIFEAMRTVIVTDVMPWDLVIKGLLLALMYLPVAFLFFWWMFNRSRVQGLSRLTRL